MGIARQRQATKGSQHWIQRYVNQHPGELTAAIAGVAAASFSTELDWRSPLEAEGYAEYFDADFLLRAYRERCSVCRLKHAELLDAAHILPDNDPRGEPVVANGLALCKLHHAAYDRHILGVTPDCTVEIRRDILEEVDGPMLVHGLQGMNGRSLHVPRSRELKPRREFLEARYEVFRRAG